MVKVTRKVVLEYAASKWAARTSGLAHSHVFMALHFKKLGEQN
jgi:hypothetical protein